MNHEDKLYKEPVRVIESAAPLTTSSNQKLRDLAKAVLEVTDQEAVYVQYPDQTVEIIER